MKGLAVVPLAFITGSRFGEDWSTKPDGALLEAWLNAVDILDESQAVFTPPLGGTTNGTPGPRSACVEWMGKPTAGNFDVWLGRTWDAPASFCLYSAELVMVVVLRRRLFPSSLAASMSSRSCSGSLSSSESAWKSVSLSELSLFFRFLLIFLAGEGGNARVSSEWSSSPAADAASASFFSVA